VSGAVRAPPADLLGYSHGDHRRARSDLRCAAARGDLRRRAPDAGTLAPGAAGRHRGRRLDRSGAAVAWPPGGCGLSLGPAPTRPAGGYAPRIVVFTAGPFSRRSARPEWRPDKAAPPPGGRAPRGGPQRGDRPADRSAQQRPGTAPGRFGSLHAPAAYEAALVPAPGSSAGPIASLR